jgi:hypothetical protein
MGVVEHSAGSDRPRWFLVALVGLVFAGCMAGLVWRPWDARVSNGQARQAVAAKYARDGSAVRCKRSDMTPDDTTPDLGDVDYRCEVGEGERRFTVLVGSDGTRVTQGYPLGL